MKTIGRANTVYGKVLIRVGRYPAGGALYVDLFNKADGPVTTLSTNLVPYGAAVASDEFTVKCWSENEPVIDAMLATGLFEDTGRRIPTGYVTAPVWRIKDARLVP